MNIMRRKPGRRSKCRPSKDSQNQKPSSAGIPAFSSAAVRRQQAPVASSSPNAADWPGRRNRDDPTCPRYRHLLAERPSGPNRACLRSPQSQPPQDAPSLGTDHRRPLVASSSCRYTPIAEFVRCANQASFHNQRVLSTSLSELCLARGCSVRRGRRRVLRDPRPACSCRELLRLPHIREARRPRDGLAQRTHQGWPFRPRHSAGPPRSGACFSRPFSIPTNA